MLSFEAKEYTERGKHGGPPGSKFQVGGRRAPGTGILIVQEGTGWVMLQDGAREALRAKSIVIYDTGDWVEYGTDDWFTANEYWAASEPEEAVARLAAVFGPDDS